MSLSTLLLAIVGGLALMSTAVVYLWREYGWGVAQITTPNSSVARLEPTKNQIVCIACDNPTHPNEAMRGPDLLLPEVWGGGVMCQLWFCRACMEQSVDTFELELTENHSISSSRPATIRLQEDPKCNFCARLPTQVDKVLRLCGFYQTTDAQGPAIQRVVHDRFFHAAYADENPTLLGHICACDACILSGLNAMSPS